MRPVAGRAGLKAWNPEALRSSRSGACWLADWDPALPGEEGARSRKAREGDPALEDRGAMGRAEEVVVPHAWQGHELAASRCR